jgi:hypothetical protein
MKILQVFLFTILLVSNLYLLVKLSIVEKRIDHYHDKLYSLGEFVYVTHHYTQDSLDRLEEVNAVYFNRRWDTATKTMRTK